MPRHMPALLTDIFSKIKDVSGDIAEIGVYRGTSSLLLAHGAAKQERKFHAFDSFCGMDSPTDGDGKDGSRQYPKGRLAFSKDRYEVTMRRYQTTTVIHAGFVPKCFEGVDNLYALVYVDLDHYQPTKDAIDWAWGRINPGGAMLLDDYFPSKTILASKAINEWLAANQPDAIPCVPVNNQQLVWKVGVSV